MQTIRPALTRPVSVHGYARPVKGSSLQPFHLLQVFSLLNVRSFLPLNVVLSVAALVPYFFRGPPGFLLSLS